MDDTVVVNAVDRVRALLLDPRARDELRYHSFVFPRHRLLYVETPKAACTSVKTGLLSLTGSTVAELNAQASVPPAFPEAIVHTRGLYPVPSLSEIPAHSPGAATLPDIEAVLGSPDWLRFCVVRNPFARLFSAWQTQVFLGDDAMLDLLVPLGVGDHIVGADLDVRATFADFVRDLADRPEHFFADMHFRPQARVVRIGVIPYTHVVHLHELGSFLPTLQSHVRRADPTAVITLPHVHEGLGIPWQLAYDGATLALVADLYADDLAAFGFEVPEIVDTTRPLIDSVGRKLLERNRMRTRQMAATRRVIAASTVQRATV